MTPIRLPSLPQTLLPSIVAASLLLLAACKEEEAAPAAAGAAGQGVALASGDVAALQEVVTNAPGATGATARFRFVLAGLKPDEDRSADMQALCDGYGLAHVTGMVPPPRQIVISLADRETPFGEAAPDAVQFFEAYRVENDRCIWEMF